MKKITATQKVILEFYMEIWYCYDYENGSMANPLFTSTSYDLADAEAKDAGYEVVQVIEFEDEEETEAAPTPTSKEGLEDGFTKGDWIIEETPNDGDTSHIICSADKETTIAGIYKWPVEDYDKEAEANARLIAESKNMHHALKCFVGAVDIIVEAEGSLTEERRQVYVSIKNSLTYTQAKAILTRINKD